MPIVFGGGGGGSAPVTHEQLRGDPVTIADAASALLPWTDSLGPNTLVNRTTPTLPTIITSGVYAFSLITNASALTAGGTYIARLSLDHTDDDWTYDTQPTGPAVRGAVAATYYLAAGMQVAVRAFSFDGAAARDFSIFTLTVQRLA